MTIFRLEHFPNVCRICLHHSPEGMQVPLDEYMQQYSAKLIDIIDELTAPIPSELLHITPYGVCMACFEELNSFLAYRNRLKLVVAFVSSLAQVAKGQTGALEKLIGAHRAELLAVLQELKILEKDELLATDLLEEFDQYCIGGMLADSVVRETTKGKGRESPAELSNEDIQYREYLRPNCDEIEPEYCVVASETGSDGGQKEEPVDDSFQAVSFDVSIVESVDVVKTIPTESTDDDGIVRTKRSVRKGVRKKGELQQCMLCSFQTIHFTTFQTHMKKHHKEACDSTWFCKRCNLKFASKRELAQHKRSAHRDFICDTCGMAFDCRFSLHTHRKRHEDVRQYRCEYCPMEYYTKTERALHVRQAHLKVFEVKCTVCELPFLTKHMLNQHMKSHTDQRTHPCSICGFSFKSHTHLNRHMKGVHLGVQYTCEHCSASYRRKDKLRLHMEKVHSIQTYFVCDICLLSYTTEEKLESHKEHHRNPKDLQCGVCLGAYLTQAEFNDHLCITYRENYICCDRDFKFQSYYNKHMFLAHGEHTNARVKPTDGLLMGQRRAMRRQEIRCPKCGQEFTTRNQKKQHQESCSIDIYEEEEHHIEQSNCLDE